MLSISFRLLHNTCLDLDLLVESISWNIFFENAGIILEETFYEYEEGIL